MNLTIDAISRHLEPQSLSPWRFGEWHDHKKRMPHGQSLQIRL
jgi:hypothetical protein